MTRGLIVIRVKQRCDVMFEANKFIHLEPNHSRIGSFYYHVHVGSHGIFLVLSWCYAGFRTLIDCIMFLSLHAMELVLLSNCTLRGLP